VFLFLVSIKSDVALGVIRRQLADVGKVTLKSNGDEALSDESLLKSNDDEALNNNFP
jgi:hypothetical protein